MKQLFHIERGRADLVQPVLSLQVGEKHISFAITNKTGNELFELAYCSSDNPELNGWNENSLADFFSRYPSLHQSFYQVFVSFDTPQSMLTPSSLYKPEAARELSGSLQGSTAGSHTVSELIPSWQLYNTYTIPDEVYNWVQKTFPSARSYHQYTLAVKKLKAAGHEGNFLVDFRTEDFTILVAKDSQWMLAQCFPYSTPGDILYYLLKACHQFKLLQQDVNLQVSGLIDQHSALYKELYLYFIHIHFRNAGWDTGADYPAHFFTSLNDLAQCAS